MPVYKKKPVKVEAVQFTGENHDDIIKFTGGQAIVGLPTGEGTECITIPTLEGPMVANPGDFVICGIAGEFYPCKPDIFENSYDLIEEES